MSDRSPLENAKPAILGQLRTEDAYAQRRCVRCGVSYAIEAFFDSVEYFARPTNYAEGCVTHCLGCWLGVGGPESTEELGHALRDLGSRLCLATHLVVMPLVRVHSESPIDLGKIIFYPFGADLSGLAIDDPAPMSSSLSEVQSAASGVDLKAILQHPTVAFAARFDWDAVLNSSHRAHMSFLRRLSRYVDEQCLDFVRYRYCRLDRADFLPGRAGQLSSNPMMAGLVLYNAARQTGRVFGGSAFTHLIVRGLGLDIEASYHSAPLQNGEVGYIARRALSLYKAALEAEDDSVKYMQVVALMDFLAEPAKYVGSADIAKAIIRYSAETSEDYLRLKERFAQLYGKQVEGRYVGIRTRIVHLGENLESIIPDESDRTTLFREISQYVGKVIDHMIDHSALDWDAYLEVRRKLGPFGLS